jgi:hypothetical protein
MLFGKTVAAHCEDHTKHTNTLCGQNADFEYVKANCIYNDHWLLRGYFLLFIYS